MTFRLSRLDIFFVVLLFLLTVPFLRLIPFTDEYEHAMSGWFLLNGLIPYRDFFSHHAPLPLFLGLSGYLVAVIEPILELRVWILVASLGAWVWLLNRSNQTFKPIIYSVMLAFGLATPKLLLNMALADTFVTYALVIFLLLLVNEGQQKKINFQFLMWAFVCTAFISFWSSVASFLPLLILFLALGFLAWKQAGLRIFSTFAKQLLVFVLGNLLLLSPFILTGSWADFWWSVFTYNTQYYFPYHLAGAGVDAKYGFVFQVGREFLQQFQQTSSDFLSKSLVFIKSIVGVNQLLRPTLFQQIPDYLSIVFREYSRFFEVFQNLIFIALILFLLTLLLRKKLLLALFSLILFVGMFFRSNEVFHWGPLFGTVVIALTWLITEAKRQKQPLSLAITALIMFLIAVNLLTFYQETLRQRQLYISPQYQTLAAEINTLLDDKSKVMVLDRNMIYYPLSKTLPACRYQYYLPWLHATARIRAEVENCLKAGVASVLIVPELTPEVEALLPTVGEKYHLASGSGQLFVKTIGTSK